MKETLKNFRSSAKITKIIINEIDKTINLHKNYRQYIIDNYDKVKTYSIYKSSNFKYAQDKNMFYQDLIKSDDNVLEINKIIEEL